MQRPQHLAIHLKLVPSAQNQSGNVEAYVGWTGMASASSLNQFRSTQNAEKALETIEIDPQYAQGLGLSQGDLVRVNDTLINLSSLLNHFQVEIGLLHDLPLATSVATEPLTSDDWEIIVGQPVIVLSNCRNTFWTGNPRVTRGIYSSFSSPRC